MEKTVTSANNLCFACGRANPIGLKLVFRQEDGKAKAEFTPGPYHQSWDGVFHGGLLALCLDEAGGYALYFQGIKAMTARMEMRLRKTVRPGEKIFLTGEIRKKTRRLVETYAKVELEDGTLAAEGTATMFIVGEKDG
jgi:acyl-coenzyme A thioesterase PaaI-like protein